MAKRNQHKNGDHYSNATKKQIAYHSLRVKIIQYFPLPLRGKNTIL